MAKFVHTVREIGCPCNGREVCEAPKVCKVTESARLLRGSNICICPAEGLLKFVLVKEGPGAGSRACEKGLG
jgi:hypothetical protein